MIPAFAHIAKEYEIFLADCKKKEELNARKPIKKRPGDSANEVLPVVRNGSVDELGFGQFLKKLDITCTKVILMMKLL